MVATILSDEVINPTELRNNQKLWLDKAYTNPISIMNGTRKLVLLNRDHAKDMYLLNHYAKMIIQFCHEMDSEQAGKSDVFPWTKHLSKEAIAEFHRELLLIFNDVIHSGNWLALEEMLDAWISTAEALTNPEMAELLTADLGSEGFTRVE